MFPKNRLPFTTPFVTNEEDLPSYGAANNPDDLPDLSAIGEQPSPVTDLPLNAQSELPPAQAPIDPLIAAAAPIQQAQEQAKAELHSVPKPATTRPQESRSQTLGSAFTNKPPVETQTPAPAFNPAAPAAITPQAPAADAPPDANPLETDLYKTFNVPKNTFLDGQAPVVTPAATDLYKAFDVPNNTFVQDQSTSAGITPGQPMLKDYLPQMDNLSSIIQPAQNNPVAAPRGNSQRYVINTGNVYNDNPNAPQQNIFDDLNQIAIHGLGANPDLPLPENPNFGIREVTDAKDKLYVPFGAASSPDDLERYIITNFTSAGNNNNAQLAHPDYYREKYKQDSGDQNVRLFGLKKNDVNEQGIPYTRELNPEEFQDYINSLPIVNGKIAIPVPEDQKARIRSYITGDRTTMQGLPTDANTYEQPTVVKAEDIPLDPDVPVSPQTAAAAANEGSYYLEEGMKSFVNEIPGFYSLVNSFKPDDIKGSVLDASDITEVPGYSEMTPEQQKAAQGILEIVRVGGALPPGILKAVGVGVLSGGNPLVVGGAMGLDAAFRAAEHGGNIEASVKSGIENGLTFLAQPEVEAFIQTLSPAVKNKIAQEILAATRSGTAFTLSSVAGETAVGKPFTDRYDENGRLIEEGSIEPGNLSRKFLTGAGIHGVNRAIGIAPAEGAHDEITNPATILNDGINQAGRNELSARAQIPSADEALRAGQAATGDQALPAQPQRVSTSEMPVRRTQKIEETIANASTQDLLEMKQMLESGPSNPRADYALGLIEDRLNSAQPAPPQFTSDIDRLFPKTESPNQNSRIEDDPFNTQTRLAKDTEIPPPEGTITPEELDTAISLKPPDKIVPAADVTVPAEMSLNPDEFEDFHSAIDSHIENSHLGQMIDLLHGSGLSEQQIIDYLATHPETIQSIQDAEANIIDQPGNSELLDKLKSIKQPSELEAISNEIKQRLTDAGYDPNDLTDNDIMKVAPELAAKYKEASRRAFPKMFAVDDAYKNIEAAMKARGFDVNNLSMNDVKLMVPDLYNKYIQTAKAAFPEFQGTEVPLPSRQRLTSRSATAKVKPVAKEGVLNVEQSGSELPSLNAASESNLSTELPSADSKPDGTVSSNGQAPPAEESSNSVAGIAGDATNGIEQLPASDSAAGTEVVDPNEPLPGPNTLKNLYPPTAREDAGEALPSQQDTILDTISKKIGKTVDQLKTIFGKNKTASEEELKAAFGRKKPTNIKLIDGELKQVNPEVPVRYTQAAEPIIGRMTQEDYLNAVRAMNNGKLDQFDIANHQWAVFNQYQAAKAGKAKPLSDDLLDSPLTEKAPVGFGKDAITPKTLREFIEWAENGKKPNNDNEGKAPSRAEGKKKLIEQGNKKNVKGATTERIAGVDNPLPDKPLDISKTVRVDENGTDIPGTEQQTGMIQLRNGDVFISGKLPANASPEEVLHRTVAQYALKSIKDIAASYDKQNVVGRREALTSLQDEIAGLMRPTDRPEIIATGPNGEELSIRPQLGVDGRLKFSTFQRAGKDAPFIKVSSEADSYADALSQFGEAYSGDPDFKIADNEAVRLAEQNRASGNTPIPDTVIEKPAVERDESGKPTSIPEGSKPVMVKLPGTNQEVPGWQEPDTTKVTPPTAAVHVELPGRISRLTIERKNIRPADDNPIPIEDRPPGGAGQLLKPVTPNYYPKVSGSKNLGFLLGFMGGSKAPQTEVTPETRSFGQRLYDHTKSFFSDVNNLLNAVSNKISVDAGDIIERELPKLKALAYDTGKKIVETEIAYRSRLAHRLADTRVLSDSIRKMVPEPFSRDMKAIGEFLFNGLQSINNFTGGEPEFNDIGLVHSIVSLEQGDSDHKLGDFINEQGWTLPNGQKLTEHDFHVEQLSGGDYRLFLRFAPGEAEDNYARAVTGRADATYEGLKNGQFTEVPELKQIMNLMNDMRHFSAAEQDILPIPGYVHHYSEDRVVRGKRVSLQEYEARPRKMRSGLLLGSDTVKRDAFAAFERMYQEFVREQEYNRRTKEVVELAGLRQKDINEIPGFTKGKELNKKFSRSVAHLPNDTLTKLGFSQEEIDVMKAAGFIHADNGFFFPTVLENMLNYRLRSNDSGYVENLRDMHPAIDSTIAFFKDLSTIKRLLLTILPKSGAVDLASSLTALHPIKSIEDLVGGAQERYAGELAPFARFKNDIAEYGRFPERMANKAASPLVDLLNKLPGGKSITQFEGLGLKPFENKSTVGGQYDLPESAFQEQHGPISQTKLLRPVISMLDAFNIFKRFGDNSGKEIVHNSEAMADAEKYRAQLEADPNYKGDVDEAVRTFLADPPEINKARWRRRAGEYSYGTDLMNPYLDKFASNFWAQNLGDYFMRFLLKNSAFINHRMNPINARNRHAFSLETNPDKIQLNAGDLPSDDDIGKLVNQAADMYHQNKYGRDRDILHPAPQMVPEAEQYASDVKGYRNDIRKLGTNVVDKFDDINSKKRFLKVDELTQNARGIKQASDAGAEAFAHSLPVPEKTPTIPELMLAKMFGDTQHLDAARDAEQELFRRNLTEKLLKDREETAAAKKQEYAKYHQKLRREAISRLFSGSLLTAGAGAAVDLGVRAIQHFFDDKKEQPQNKEMSIQSPIGSDKPFHERRISFAGSSPAPEIISRVQYGESLYHNLHNYIGGKDDTSNDITLPEFLHANGIFTPEFMFLMKQLGFSTGKFGGPSDQKLETQILGGFGPFNPIRQAADPYSRVGKDATGDVLTKIPFASKSQDKRIDSVTGQPVPSTGASILPPLLRSISPFDISDYDTRRDQMLGQPGMSTPRIGRDDLDKIEQSTHAILNDQQRDELERVVNNTLAQQIQSKKYAAGTELTGKYVNPADTTGDLPAYQQIYPGLMPDNQKKAMTQVTGDAAASQKNIVADTVNEYLRSQGIKFKPMTESELPILIKDINSGITAAQLQTNDDIEKDANLPLQPPEVQNAIKKIINKPFNKGKFRPKGLR
jgi:hypothetical protein